LTGLHDAEGNIPENPRQQVSLHQLGACLLLACGFTAVHVQWGLLFSLAKKNKRHETTQQYDRTFSESALVLLTDPKGSLSR
jgi:hypothetical protein